MRADDFQSPALIETKHADMGRVAILAEIFNPNPAHGGEWTLEIY